MYYDLTRLDAEWTRISRSPEGGPALRRWAHSHPALGQVRDLDEVLARRRSPEAAQGVLAALAALAPRDALAARTLLQALVPGLLRLASCIANDDPSAMDEMVSLAWARVRTYPASRPGSVAGNVLLDVKKDYRRHRTVEAPRTTVDVEATRGTTVRSAEEEVVERISLAELLAAHRRAVGERGHRAIVRTALAGYSLREVAAEENVEVHTIAQRRYDARARVRRRVLAP